MTTTTTKDTETATFLWSELTFPEEIHVKLQGITSNKNIFLVSSCPKPNAITFFRSWSPKIATQT